MKAAINTIQGGVTAPAGFKAAGTHVGIKRKRKDLALLCSDQACDYAAVFTTSTAKGAPILWNQQVKQESKKIKGIVINSGNANACTGFPGLLHAKQMAETTAAMLGVSPLEVMVASTGIIGVPLPIHKVKAGIRNIGESLAADLDSGTSAAEAIVTTDSFVKQMAVQIEIGGCMVTLGAMSKGSGMVHPNMATMLGFLTTDLNITGELLQKALSESVDETYNMISVDGATSTNDMVLLMANGAAGNTCIADSSDPGYATFVEALSFVNETMAKQIAGDGEGATKLLEVQVKGAENLADARKLARAVVSSNLVKTMLFAEDVNWGRFVAAMGSTGVQFDLDKLCISVNGGEGDVCLLMDGTPYWTAEEDCAIALSSPQISLMVELNSGNFDATAWGCDLTYDYVRITGSYTKRGAVPIKVEGVA